MRLLEGNPGLYTDHYELTMAQGYFLNGMENTPALFDYFFRKLPYDGGYVILAGLAELLRHLEGYRFPRSSIAYLSGLGFDSNFLGYLEKFRFSGDVFALREGEIVFPYEPCISIRGTVIESQLVETLLLNLVNFESLVATKAARMKQAAGERMLVDFGLRRAQGYGGIHASHAAVTGGFQKTSNTFSAAYFGLQPSGTMAHSWVQAFGDELESFRAFAEVNPDNCILLVDTYDTLNSGVPNAIRVGQEMKKKGDKLRGIRLDSGDLSYLSKKARKMLDLAGLDDVKILASNQLDEHVISSLLEQSAPIDAFGVGTALVTGKGSGALDGVYKLSMINGKPTLKVSETMQKVTLPGDKKLHRFSDGEGLFRADAISRWEEEKIPKILHPFEKEKHFDTAELQKETLTRKVMEDGKILIEPDRAEDAAAYARERLSMLPGEHKRFMFPHLYKVGVTPSLIKMRDELVDQSTVNH